MLKGKRLLDFANLFHQMIKKNDDIISSYFKNEWSI